jgi:hypothetical protein
MTLFLPFERSHANKLLCVFAALLRELCIFGAIFVPTFLSSHSGLIREISAIRGSSLFWLRLCHPKSSL